MNRLADVKKRNGALLGIFLLVLIASLPLLVDYHFANDGVAVWMARMEALAERICRGKLFSGEEALGMWTEEGDEFIFCGNLCLIFPALLRAMGLSAGSAYRIFLAAANLVTAVFAYVSFSQSFKSRSIGMFGCVLYTLAPYRLYIMYSHMDAGEVTAMMFLPLLVWGFYEIYMEESLGKWHWVILAAGFLGLVYSHPVLFEIAAFFGSLLCLILWKKTFRRHVFWKLCCTVGAVALLGGWRLISCINGAAWTKYASEGGAPVLIQERGILPAHIFYTLQAGGTSSQFAQQGMINTAPIGMGAALLLCILLWLALYAGHGEKVLTDRQQQRRKAGNILLALDGMALVMSTCFFPWDFFGTCSSWQAGWNGLLYSPVKITAMVTIFSVVVACIMGERMRQEEVGFLSGRTVLVLIVMVSVLFGNYQLNDILMTSKKFTGTLLFMPFWGQ